jgi:predicted AlkP superfamily pyrophosphatase or phosphodiesterase
MFVVFKLLMLKFAKDPELRDRQLDKTYNNGTDNFETTVIVISIDGFRPDYLNRGLTPHLQNLGIKKITLYWHC